MEKWRIALWAAIVVAALAFLWAVRSILLPFALAWIIAVMLEPVVRWMRLRGMSRGFSVTSITLVFFLVLGALAVYATPKITGQFGELQKSIQRLTETIAAENQNENHFVRWNPAIRAQPAGPIANVDKALEWAAPTLERAGLPTTRRQIVDQYISPQRDAIAKGIANFFNGFFKLLIGAASQLFILIFLPIFVFMLLLDMETIKVKSANWIPPSIRAGTLSMIEDISEVFKSYLRGVLINVLLFTTVMGLLFAALGLPYFLLLAVLAGTLYLIPVIGGFISAPSIFLIVGFSGATPYWMPTIDSSWVFAAIAMGVFVVVSTAYDMIVTPRTVGKAVGLHPLVSMFVVFSGGALFGLPGMILAYPLAGSIKVTLSRLMRLTNAPTLTEEIRLPSVPVRHREAAEV